MTNQQLIEKARQIRLDSIEMIAKAGSGHPGGSLSAADLMVALYYSKMALFEDPHDERRDRFVLSKGHSNPPLYAILADKGYVAKEELQYLRRLHHPFQGHPESNKCPGVDCSTGSLGQGVSVATGMALGFKLKNIQSESANPQADVMFGGLQYADLSAYGEYFETYVCANDSKMMPDYKNTSGKLTFQDAQIPCIIVNEEQEKAAGVTITGWDSLLDPALTGKIAIADPTASSSAWNFLQCLLTDFGGWDNDAAWEYIEKFIPHMGQVGRGTVPCPTHCPTRKSGIQNRPLSHGNLKPSTKRKSPPQSTNTKQTATANGARFHLILRMAQRRSSGLPIGTR